MTDEQRKTLEEVQDDANTPKHRLMDLQNRLEEAGLTGRAKSLGSIICNLERWQNNLPLK